MGTRNLTAVFADGEYKLAQYGQWDGYPSGQGKIALKFARGALCISAGRQDFKGQLAKVRFVEQDELASMYATVGVTGSWCNMDQVNAFNRKWPYFSRDHGARILDLVMNANDEVLTRNEITFAASSSCEYAYVVDLDKNTFEAYEGYNKTPLDPSERFADMPGQDGYYPVRLRGSWSLDALPTDEELMAAFPSEDEEGVES
jgi:hypothetical protein